MQLRTMVFALAAGLSLACIAGLASAQQIYKWKDASGVTHFSQTPPPNGTHYTKMYLNAEPEVSSNPAPATSADTTAPAAGASPSAGTPANSMPDTPANRTRLCQQLGSNIALLEGSRPVVTTGANGKQQLMDNSARAQQLATAQQQQAQYCSGGSG